MDIYEYFGLYLMFGLLYSIYLEARTRAISDELFFDKLPWFFNMVITLIFVMVAWPKVIYEVRKSYNALPSESAGNIDIH